MKQTGRTTSILYLAIVLSLGAGLRERLRLNDAISEISVLRERALHLGIHRKALLSRLNEVGLSTPFLTADGEVGLESDGVIIQEPSQIVLYYLSTECQICPLNYGFLNDLTDSGVPVVGLVFDPAEGAVERHRSEWDVRFPILVNPQGSAVDVVPRYGTPAIVVISQERVAFLEFGELTTKSQEALRSYTASWGQTDTHLPAN